MRRNIVKQKGECLENIIISKIKFNFFFKKKISTKPLKINEYMYYYMNASNFVCACIFPGNDLTYDRI